MAVKAGACRDHLIVILLPARRGALVQVQNPHHGGCERRGGGAGFFVSVLGFVDREGATAAPGVCPSRSEQHNTRLMGH